MKNSFIFGVVWTAIVVLIISFGVTVALLEQDSESVNNIEINDKDKKQIIYDIAQTSIRTNPAAYNKNEKNEEVSSLKNNTENQVENINLEIEKKLKKTNEMLESTSDFSENKEVIEVAKFNNNFFEKPISTEILRPFSLNELIYSPTLNEWNIHVGTDFKAKLGDEVKSIQSGIVKTISSNDKYGEYIIIEHTNGYESLYANITVLDALKEGIKVEQGQLIGYVAESFGFEVLDETHLHFELKKDGEYVPF